MGPAPASSPGPISREAARARRPLRPGDPVRPETVYGRTKVEGERAIARVAREQERWGAAYTVVRTAWLFSGEVLPGHRDFVSTMLRLARENGLYPQLTISVAFGCPFEGRVNPDTVIAIATEMAGAGAEEIALADTIGVGVPPQVEELIARTREAVPGVRLRAHFHNTRGTGVANAWAAYRAGAEVLDSSLGGLGGCPFAPNATGNIATEDLIYMLDQAGIETGLDLGRLIDASRWFETVMGKPLPSMVAKAGGFPGG